MKRKERGISRAQQLDIKPFLVVLYIIPLIVWTLIVYHFWWHEKKTRWKFGKLVILPLIFPFLYTFVNLWIDLSNPIPFPPDFKMCFHSFSKKKGKEQGAYMTTKLEKHLVELGILGMFNMKCQTTILPEINGFLSNLNSRVDAVAGGLLLVGLVATAFKKKSLFKIRMIRNFMALCLTFTILFGGFAWYISFWLKTLLLIKFLGVIESMNIASFLIVILGFVYETVF